MAEPELGTRKPVEHTAEYQTQGVRAGLEGPFPGGAAQSFVPFQDWSRHNRIGRVQVDQRAEHLGALPKWIKRRVVEILPIGMAVDHGAAEFQFLHAAL